MSSEPYNVFFRAKKSICLVIEKKKKQILYTMFNSIKKDNNCRKLVKSFEILRLQNKILVQAMSLSDAAASQKTPKMLNMTLFDKVITKIDDKKSAFTSLVSSPSSLTLPNEKSLSVNAKQEFYNHNCFTDLELYKSSFYLFAKKKAKNSDNKKQVLSKSGLITIQKSSLTVVELQSKALYAIPPKSRDNSPKEMLYPQPSSSTVHNTFSKLSFLAKDRILSMPRNSSKGRIKNRCIETGRAHSVLRFCKLSRIGLRDNASKGLISGISKASW